MKKSFEAFHILIHTLVLFHLYQLPYWIKNVYFLFDGGIVLHHFIYYPIMNRFHSVMIYIHMWIHLEAVLYLLFGKESLLFIDFERTFALSEGVVYNHSMMDYLYALGTLQDIVTHGLNIISV